MPPIRLSGLRSVAALALAAAAAMHAARASEPVAPLPAVQEALAPATLAGEGQMRFLGLRIYEARLWMGPRFEAHSYDAHPLALELTYHRAFTGQAIAARSVDEMQRQRPLPASLAERWQQLLAQLLPDVQPGERLTGLYRPGHGMQLWHGNRELGEIQDAELARLFFGIWLSPRTSEPGLRTALLARSGGGAR
jgi:hypothetical protein